MGSSKGRELRSWLIVAAIATLAWGPPATVEAQEDAAPTEGAEGDAEPVSEPETEADEADAEEPETEADEADAEEAEELEAAEVDEDVPSESSEADDAPSSGELDDAEAELEAMFEAQASDEPSPDEAAEAETEPGGDGAEGELGLEAEAELDVAPREHGLFFARVELGAGYGMTDQIASAEVHSGGFSIAGSASVGISVTNDLAIHAEAFGAFTPVGSFTTQFRAAEVEFDGSGTLMTYAAGIGLTHWLVPGDFYVKAAGGAAWGRVQVDGIDVGNPGLGWGMTLGAGKNFWLSDHLAVGVGAYFMYMSVPDERGFMSADPDIRLTKRHKFNFTNFGLSGSVAFN